jgi:hypothetical protein
MASLSRTAPSMTTATIPSAMHCCVMISPISALERSPLPSTTRTSPGLAIAMAA